MKKTTSKELNMSLFKASSQNIFKTLTAIFLLINTTSAYSCNKAQLIDYDYQIKETLANGYASFGRLWLLDNNESCVESLKYGICISVKPVANLAEITLKISKDKGTASTYSQKIKYNSSEVIRFNTMSMNVYFKLFVSNTIADMKMSGKSCQSGLPTIPRQVTRQELDNMYKG